MRRRLAAPLSLLTLVGSLLVWLAAVPIVSAGDPCYHGFSMPPETTASSAQVSLLPCAFSPTVTQVDVGETVTFTNGTDFTHLVTGANQAWGSRDIELQPGATTSYTFDTAGAYPYACALHRGMAGVILVGDAVAGGGRGRGIRHDRRRTDRERRGAGRATGRTARPRGPAGGRVARRPSRVVRLATRRRARHGVRRRRGARGLTVRPAGQIRRNTIPTRRIAVAATNAMMPTLSGTSDAVRAQEPDDDQDQGDDDRPGGRGEVRAAHVRSRGAVSRRPAGSGRRTGTGRPARGPSSGRRSRAGR